MIKGAHLSESYLLTLHVMNVLNHDYVWGVENLTFCTLDLA